MFRSRAPHDAIEGIVPGLAGMHDVDDYSEAQTIPGLFPTLPTAMRAYQERPEGSQAGNQGSGGPA